eukprot:356832_1
MASGSPIQILWMCISLLFVICISFYHIISLQKYDKLHCTKFICLTVIFLSSGVTAMVNFLIMNIVYNDNDWSYEHCLYVKYLRFYLVFKCSLYLILINRISTVFGKPSYRILSPRGLTIWAIIIILWGCINLLIQYITVGCTQNADGHFSLTNIRYSMVTFGLLDIVACIGTTYLFSQPIFKLQTENAPREFNSLISEFSDVNQDVNDVDIATLQYIALKQCVLSIISVVSTVFALILMYIANTMSVFVCLDIVISISCIMLMEKWNSKIANFLCCLCLKKAHLKKSLQQSIESNTTKTITDEIELPQNTNK